MHSSNERPFGLPFTSLGIEAITGAVTQPFAAGPCRRIYTANVDHIVKLRGDADFRAAYRDCWIVTADGTPVWLYARWRMRRDISRVTGADMVPAILAALDPATTRPVFLCATAEIAAAIRADLAYRHFADEAVLTDVPPFGFDRDAEISAALADAVRSHRATHLFLGVGAPRSEIWAWRWQDAIGPCWVFPVGAALAFHVGLEQRAPRIMRRVGMEWLWRMLQQPHRLARRYLVASWPFLAAISDDLRGRSLVK